MYSLILDSSTQILYISLVKDNEVLFEKYMPGNKDHAKNIVYLVNQALENNHIESKDLDEIIVGYGPGSYTGVRMAVTVGKMMATMEPNIKMYSISTLVLMASGYTGNVLATIDARRGNCFGCVYNMTNNEFDIEEGLYPLDDILLDSHDYHVNENEYKVSPLKVIELADFVEEPHTIVPNYLRDTEAERNINA